MTLLFDERVHFFMFDYFRRSLYLMYLTVCNYFSEHYLGKTLQNISPNTWDILCSLYRKLLLKKLETIKIVFFNFIIFCWYHFLSHKSLNDLKPVFGLSLNAFAKFQFWGLLSCFNSQIPPIHGNVFFNPRGSCYFCHDLKSESLNFGELVLEGKLILRAPFQDSELSIAETFISAVYSIKRVENQCDVKESREESKTEISGIPQLKPPPPC